MRLKIKDWRRLVCEHELRHKEEKGLGMPGSKGGFNPPNEVRVNIYCENMYVTYQHEPCLEQGVATKRETPWKARLDLLSNVMSILCAAVKILMTTGMV